MSTKRKTARDTGEAAAKEAAREPGNLAEDLLGTLSYDPVCRAIYRAIQEGELRPGVKLGEDQLASLFKVNRARVREALRQLSSIGLVTIFRNRGAFVARPSRQDAEETYAARILVESHIIASIAQHHSKGDLAILRDHISQQNAAYQSGNRRHYIRLLGEFHLVLANIAGNRVLGQFLAQLVAQTVLIVMLYDRGGPPDCSLTEHKEMLAAIKAGDVAASQKLMRDHLQATMGRLDFDQDEEQVDLASIFGPILAGSRT
ncbi:MAG: GntR family transcriptional regulator [Kiloniellaceae bacterium]